MFPGKSKDGGELYVVKWHANGEMPPDSSCSYRPWPGKMIEDQPAHGQQVDQTASTVQLTRTDLARLPA